VNSNAAFDHLIRVGQPGFDSSPSADALAMQLPIARLSRLAALAVVVLFSLAAWAGIWLTVSWVLSR
jgi:hypothetical protein